VSALRIGTGFDAHRLVEGRELVLGGVVVPNDRGLEGHSDGDCLIHAVCDALLGAVAAGDMGLHFPSGDERWRGASSLRFLDESYRIVSERGYEVVNLDVTVIARAPALMPHADRMRRNLGERLRVDTGAVSVKAKTTDGLGALGRGDGIAAQAVVLLQKKDEQP
jgi:2-C-methyl-D-erythritol 2,4-cyclodiphosphate synthase